MILHGAQPYVAPTNYAIRYIVNRSPHASSIYVGLPIAPYSPAFVSLINRVTILMQSHSENKQSSLSRYVYNPHHPTSAMDQTVMHIRIILIAFREKT
jgi:hypothetical protein